MKPGSSEFAASVDESEQLWILGNSTARSPTRQLNQTRQLSDASQPDQASQTKPTRQTTPTRQPDQPNQPQPSTELQSGAELRKDFAEAALAGAPRFPVYSIMNGRASGFVLAVDIS
jgi:hypothetical protein